MAADDAHYSAREAAEALGVSLPTLYAYVSRGLLRSEAAPGTKARRYPRADVEALVRRRDERGEPGPIAEGALAWGTPVMPSAITLIEGGRYYYRGRDATRLATAWPFERVAAWLWTGEDEAELPPDPPAPLSLAAREGLGELDAVAACQALLPVVAAHDPAAWDLRPAAVARTGARILRAMAAIMVGAAVGEPGAAVSDPVAAVGDPVAAALACAWGADDPDARAAIDVALGLSADHELNVSTFAARCAASAAATPYDVVLAGLATLRGARHGGHSERVAALLDEAREPAHAARTVAARLRRGDAVPGFGHPLYPEGDPRGALLLTLAAHLRPDDPAVALGEAVAAAGLDLLGERPTIDLGLIVLARALGLPADAPLALFALGRTAGWLAHAIEQYEAGALIRPRARYVGLPPTPPALA